MAASLCGDHRDSKCQRAKYRAIGSRSKACIWQLPKTPKLNGQGLLGLDYGTFMDILWIYGTFWPPKISVMDANVDTNYDSISSQMPMFRISVCLTI